MSGFKVSCKAQHGIATNMEKVGVVCERFNNHHRKQRQLTQLLIFYFDHHLLNYIAK